MCTSHAISQSWFSNATRLWTFSAYVFPVLPRCLEHPILLRRSSIIHSVFLTALISVLNSVVSYARRTFVGSKIFFLQDGEKAKPVATSEDSVRFKFSWPRISLQSVSSQKTCVCSLYNILLVNTCYTTGRTVRDRIPVGTRFSARPDRPWGPPSLL